MINRHGYLGKASVVKSQKIMLKEQLSLINRYKYDTMYIYAEILFSKI